MPKTAPRPRIVIAKERLEHLEDLAQGAMSRTPDLADQLLTELSRAKLVAEAALPADVVDIDRPLVYRDEATGREVRVTLVWPENANIDAGHISVMTPIGVALIGLQAGARFTWETRSGEERELIVLSVGAESDAA